MEIEEILNCILHFAASAFVISGILLWLRRKSGGKARAYLSAVCLFSGLCFFTRLFGTNTGTITFDSVLPLQNLIGGSVVMIMFYIYPIEVISPGWFTKKRTVMLSLPCLVILAVTLFAPIQYRALSSFSDILQYAGEPNVWIRLLILLIIQLYVFVTTIVPHNWRRSSVSNLWIRFYTSLIFCMGVLYGLFLITGIPEISSLHLLFCFLFCILITYQELFLRIEVPAAVLLEPTTVDYPAPVTEILIEENQNIHPLWTELGRLMKEQELWRNPDLTQEYLATLLKTNRTTLSDVIRENGFLGYKEYVNRIRIDEYLKIVNSEQYVSSQEAFFRVGYRSRMTALRYFQQFLGCTPSEYLNRLSDDMQE